MSIVGLSRGVEDNTRAIGIDEFIVRGNLVSFRDISCVCCGMLGFRDDETDIALANDRYTYVEEMREVGRVHLFGEGMGRTNKHVMQELW